MSVGTSHLLVQGDARRLPLRDGSVHCVVTSVPYWNLRDYQVDGQIGLEATPAEYVRQIVGGFREVKRVLRGDAVAWLNIGDSYNAYNGGAGPSSGIEKPNHPRTTQRPKLATGYGLNCKSLKPKDLCLIPERVALALQADGWYVRAKPPWIKPNCMPESVEDRPTVAHESIFLLAKRETYFFDPDATREPHTMRPQRRPNGRPVDETPRPGQPKQAWSTTARDEPDIDGHPLGRNRRTSDWFTESLDELIDHHEAYAAHLKDVRRRGGMLVSEDGDPLAFRVTSQGWKGAHFATFPRKLVEPMIRCSTSEAGCCPACGGPWERVVERGEKVLSGHPRGNGAAHCAERAVNGAALYRTLTEQRGWRPTCACNAGPPQPAIVLDPFSGASTTLVVANALGRHGIGFDLSRDYLRMGLRRLERPHAPVERPSNGAALPLFAGMEGLA